MHSILRSVSTSSSLSYTDNRLAQNETRFVDIQDTESRLLRQGGPQNLARAAASAAYKSDIQRRSSLVANSLAGLSTVVPSTFSPATPSDCSYYPSPKPDGTDYEYGAKQNTMSTRAMNDGPSSASQSLRTQLPSSANEISPSKRPCFDDGARQPSSYKRLKKARSIMIVTTPTVRSTSKKPVLRAPKSESFLRGGQNFMPESLKRQHEKRRAMPHLYRKASSFFQKTPSKKPSIAPLDAFQLASVIRDEANQSKDSKDPKNLRKSKGSFRTIRKMGGTVIRSVREKLGIRKFSRKPLQVPIQHIISSKEHYTTNPEDTGRCGFEIHCEMEPLSVRSHDPLFSRLSYDVGKEIPNTRRSISPINGNEDAGIRTSAANTWNTSAIMGTVNCGVQKRLSINGPEKRISIPRAKSLFTEQTSSKEECSRIPSQQEALASLMGDEANKREEMGLDEEDVLGRNRPPPELLDVKKRLAQNSTSSRNMHERKFSSSSAAPAAGSRKSSHSWSVNTRTPRTYNNTPIVPGELEEQLAILAQATSKMALSRLSQPTSKTDLYAFQHRTQESNIQQSTFEPVNRPTSSIYSRSTNGRSVSPNLRPYHHLIASPVPFGDSANGDNPLDFASTHSFWAALDECNAKAIPPSPERGNRLKVKRRNIYYQGVTGLAHIKNNENEKLRPHTPKPRTHLAKASLATLKDRTNDSNVTIKASRSVVSFKTEVSCTQRLPLGRMVVAENLNDKYAMQDSDTKSKYAGTLSHEGCEGMDSVCFL